MMKMMVLKETMALRRMSRRKFRRSALMEQRRRNTKETPMMGMGMDMDIVTVTVTVTGITPVR